MEDKENKNIKSDAAIREERILEFWDRNKIFEKTLSKSEGRKEFVFYEGPPTANGKPGIHHLEARSFKDVIPRYKTMRGYHVRRKGGWDTHGLPVELQVEKKLGLNSKRAIEEYGIAKFNQECKESVWEYLDFWNKFTKRVGYWVDQEDPYVTYHNDYIESLWNIVKKIDEQKLLYKDYKVVPWCPRCGTALSSHELAQGYEDVKDLSVYVKFHLKPGQKYGYGKVTKDSAYILAWTTTPWTLPGNVALAVGSDINYTALRVKGNSELYILASERVESLFPDQEIEIVHDDIEGKNLVGLEYEPLFPYLAETIPDSEKGKLGNAYKVYAADFVTTEDGTGVVHTAVMYGQDDFVLGTKVGLPKHHLVNLEGRFIPGTGFLEGRFVKETDENGKPTLAVDIIKYLTDNNLFFKKENYEHSYPHCWRCKTALVYYARDSWYIRMSDPKVKSKLISENQKIHWEPAHIRDGRFGEWLREIKDWAISRERYWGTPLPVWICESCKQFDVIGSLEELQNKTKKSGNTYLVMRHGESESNVKNNMHGVVSSRVDSADHLTQKGKEQVERAAEHLQRLFTDKGRKIDLVFASPFVRTKETLEILKKFLSIDSSQIHFDARLGEINAGDFEGKPWDEYRRMFKDEKERFEKAIHGGESLLDVKRRMGDFIYEIEEKYQDKNILIISHAASLWLLYALRDGFTADESIKMTGGMFRHAEQIEGETSAEFHHFQNAEVREFSFVRIPHNREYELDMHRPFIDEVPLVCSCGGNTVRTKEVMDVWFDSGAMPFAQDHYPFENKQWVDGHGYPADYISEAIDQTRGWFYTLHAVGILMGRGRAYKNVICLGHLLDAKGKKMSKSLGNIIDPWVMADTYGVDTLRLWMYSVNQPGESKNFDEKTVALLQQQVFGLLYNVLAFYELYRDKSLESSERPSPDHILDIWILDRLDQLTSLTTRSLDHYKLLEPVRAMRDFVGDLSTWYVRRSRERVKEGDQGAKETLYFVLKTVAKLLAPFAPFSAEDIWLKLKIEHEPESVHLTEWPKGTFKLFWFTKSKVLEKMETVRHIVSLGLDARQKAGIKVRQPLGRIEIISENLPPEYLEIIKEELNVKEVIYTLKIKLGINKVHLDTKMTDELEEEGNYRELVRGLQDLRKKLGLTPSDVVTLAIHTNSLGQKLVEKFATDLKKTVLVSRIEFTDTDGEEIKVYNHTFKVRMAR